MDAATTPVLSQRKSSAIKSIDSDNDYSDDDYDDVSYDASGNAAAYDDEDDLFSPEYYDDRVSDVPEVVNMCKSLLCPDNSAESDDEPDNLGRQIRRMVVWRICAPHCYKLSTKRSGICAIFVVCVVVCLMVTLFSMRGTIANEIRWGASAFERDYWNAFDDSHLVHEYSKGYQHAHDALILQELRSSRVDDKFAAPLLMQVEQPSSHRVRSDCPPGYARRLSSSYLVGLFEHKSGDDTVIGPKTHYHMYCARLDQVEMRDALRETNSKMCSTPYASSCSGWLSHYRSSNGMRPRPLDPDQYNAHMVETLLREFSDENSLVSRATRLSYGRNIVPRTVPAQHWLMRVVFGPMIGTGQWHLHNPAPGFITRNPGHIQAEDVQASAYYGKIILLPTEAPRNPRFEVKPEPQFSPAVRSRAMLCAMYGMLTRVGVKHATRALSDVCMMLAVSRLDETTESSCAFVANAITQTLHYAEREFGRTDASRRMCMGALLTHGTMGDGAALQIDVPCSSVSALEPLAGTENPGGATLPDVARVYAMVLALSSVHIGVEPFTGGTVLRLRTAFPLGGESVFVGRHLERLLCVVLAEQLEASYALEATQRRPPNVVKAALGSLTMCTGVAVEMAAAAPMEEDRLELVLAGARVQMATDVQHIMELRRTGAGVVLFDAHLPQTYFDPRRKTLYFTAAFLVEPWSSTSQDSFVASLFYPVLQQIYFDGNTYKASVDAFAALQRCLSPAQLLPSVWVDLIQMHCESNSVGRFNRRFSVSTFNRLMFDYSDNHLKDEFQIDNYLLGNPVYRAAFNCNTK
jgi:hypothetical protein